MPLPAHSGLRFITTGLWSGLSPIAPGTVGTATCAGAFWFWSLIAPASVTVQSQIAITLLFSVAGVFAINRLFAVGLYSEKDLDPSEIVIDEFAGFAVCMVGLPFDLWHLFWGFVWFRVFDILKPPPISTLERLPLGWGIMADDLAAGVAAGFITRLIIWAF